MSENDVTPVARAEFLRLLDQQEAKGVETYGTTLQAGNGRDALNDAAEELVDAFKYVMQARMENAALRLDLAAAREREQRLEVAGNMLANTVALLNSMVRSGESHSGTSERVMRESLDTFRAAAAPSAVAQEPRGEGV